MVLDFECHRIMRCFRFRWEQESPEKGCVNVRVGQTKRVRLSAKDRHLERGPLDSYAYPRQIDNLRPAGKRREGTLVDSQHNDPTRACISLKDGEWTLD